MLSTAGLSMTAGAGAFVALIVRLRELVWTAVGLLLIKVDWRHKYDKTTISQSDKINIIIGRLITNLGLMTIKTLPYLLLALIGKQSCQAQQKGIFCQNGA